MSKHIMRVITGAGDTPIYWDPKNKKEVEVAEKSFETFKLSGCTMFSVDPKTKETQLMENFFKDVPQIVVVKPLQGG